MRILEVLSDTNRGGAGVYLESYIANRAPDIEVIVALPHGAAMAERLRAAGAHVVECSLKGDTSYNSEDIKVLKICIETFRPDIVHTHGSLSGRMAARSAGRCKTVYTKHTLSPPPAGLRKIASALLDNRLTDAAIAVSKTGAQNLRDNGLKPEKIHLVYNGIEGLHPFTEGQRADFRAHFRVEAGELVVACVARLEEIKNHAMLLAAFRQAAAKQPALRLLLAGGGSLERKLRDMAVDYGIAERITFLGELEDVRPVYGAADIFALLSHSENLPLTLLEAMSVSLPALLTRVGGMPEVVTEGESALFTDPQDAEKTASLLLRLADDPELRSTLGAAASTRFNDRFTASVFAEQTERIYRKLVN